MPKIGAVVAALENLGRDGADHRGDAVAEHALQQHHRVEQRQRRHVLEQQQGQIAADEAEIASGPHPFAPDAIGEIAEHDLAGNAGEADGPERPGGVARAEADLDEILGLMHLHGVPAEQAREIGDGNPPEARRAHGARQGPVNGRPGVVDNVGARRVRGVGGAVAIRRKADVLRPVAQQQVERHKHDEGEHRKGRGGGAPA